MYNFNVRKGKHPVRLTGDDEKEELIRNLRRDLEEERVNHEETKRKLEMSEQKNAALKQLCDQLQALSSAAPPTRTSEPTIADNTVSDYLARLTRVNNDESHNSTSRYGVGSRRRSFTNTSTGTVKRNSTNIQDRKNTEWGSKIKQLFNSRIQEEQNEETKQLQDLERMRQIEKDHLLALSLNESLNEEISSNQYVYPSQWDTEEGEQELYATVQPNLFDENDYEALLALDDSIQRIGLNNFQLRALPQGRAVTCPDEVCLICLDAFDSQIITTLPCAHRFHTNCVTQWLKQHPSCPTCKHDPRDNGDGSA